MARLTPCDPAKLQRRYDGALAAGCGVLLDRDDERLLACDELLATTMPYRGQLAVLAAAAAVDPASLRRLVAGLLRTTHAALIAHARDTGYDPDRWVRQAHLTACRDRRQQAGAAVRARRGRADALRRGDPRAES